MQHTPPTQARCHMCVARSTQPALFQDNPLLGWLQVKDGLLRAAPRRGVALVLLTVCCSAVLAAPCASSCSIQQDMGGWGVCSVVVCIKLASARVTANTNNCCTQTFCLGIMCCKALEWLQQL